MMTDDELLRYSRHILLADIDVAGQESLCQAHVMIVGLGGLGCPVALYLAASGVGHLTLVDFDEVDASNLQRQIAHTQQHIGLNKAKSAMLSVQQINPSVTVDTIEEKVDSDEWQVHLETVDIVADCTDNFATRFALNKAGYHAKKPLVSGAAIRFEGQLSVFDFRDPQTPCYQCLYSDQIDDNLSCAESGVLSPVVGVIGSLQALEVIKLIVNIGNSLTGRLLIFDAKHHQWQELQLPRDSSCPICSV